MDKNHLQSISIFAMDMALRAGSLMQQERRKGQLEHQYKSAQELVTSADLKVDELITKQIRKMYPDHRILSEESNPEEQLTDLDHPLWIIDPIDGTVNFAHHHHQVAVSIAYVEEGQVQVGVVHCPFQEETFHAIRGQQATMNHRPIQVSGLDNLRQALIGTGFPYDKSDLKPLIKRVEAILSQCQDIRRIGSAAVDICWVAMGRLDGFYESLSPWDFAAARLIAESAGAQCGHFNDVPKEAASAELWGKDILISTPALYGPLQQLLQQAT